MFPLVWKRVNRRTFAVVTVLCLAVYLWTPYDKISAILYVSPLVRFADFFFGIMLYKFYETTKHRQWPAYTEIILLAVLVLALTVHPNVDEKLRNAPIYWCILIPFIVIFVQQKGPLSRCLSGTFLEFLGTLSMPIFMIHPIVLRCMFHFFPNLHYVVMLVICILVTVVASWGIDRLFLRRIELIGIPANIIRNKDIN